MQRNVFAGSEFLLYDIDNNPIALSKNSALKVNQKLSDVTTKNSLGWTELMPTIKDWSIEFEGLVSYGSGFTFSYFYQKYQDKEPFFIRFGIIQDDFEHTFYGEVVIESINQSASMDDVATFDGSLKGIGNLSFTNEGTPEQNGYLKVETDPVFRGSPAFGITNDIKNKWNESYDKTLTEVEFVQSGNTTTLKTHLRDGSIYSSSFINIGGSGSSINNLSFNTGNGTLTVGSLTTSLDGRYQTIGDYVGLSYLQNNYYTKLQSDNSFYPLNNPDGFITADYNGFSLTSHTHSYSEITDKPTNLSFFTNDLGNYGGFLTSESDTLDSVVQRGATTNQNVSFTGSLVIPQSESSIEGAIWISDTLNSTGYTPSIVANLNDLSDVNISSASSGQALVYNGFGTWTNQSVVTDLSNYYTKSQADTKYSLTSHTHSYSEITGKPTLFSGAYSDLSGKPNNLSEFTNDLNNYGNWITKAQGDTYYPAITGYNKSNWDTAYGWGNHASAGYALANGSNASGTWGIDISGYAGSLASFNGPNTISFGITSGVLNAAKDGSQISFNIDGNAASATLADNSTKWAGFSYANPGGSPTYVLGYYGSGIWGDITNDQLKSFVGLNNGSTLTNNISGKSDGASKLWSTTHPIDFYLSNYWNGTYWQLVSNHGAPVNVGSADAWGGLNQNFTTTQTTGIGYIIGQHSNTYAYKFTEQAVKDWLGLGSAAYLNAASTGTAPNTIPSRNLYGQIEASDVYINSLGDYISNLVNKETLASVVARGNTAGTISLSNSSTTVGQLRLGNSLTGGTTWEFQSYNNGSLYINRQDTEPVMEIKYGKDIDFYGGIKTKPNTNAVVKLTSINSNNPLLSFESATSGEEQYGNYRAYSHSFITNAQVRFEIDNNGNANFAGSITAPTIQATTELIIPTVPSSTVGAIWIA